MESIGDYLREIRESKHISIDKAAKETKIMKEHIEQIENNEFSKISGATYIKGFLKTYGEYLGLSAEVLIKEYEKTYGKEDKDKNFSMLSNYQKMELAIMTIESWRPKIKKFFILLILIALGVAGFKLFPHIKKPFESISFSLKKFNLPLKVSQEPKKKSSILRDLEQIESKSSPAKTKPNPNYPTPEKTDMPQTAVQSDHMILQAASSKNVWISLKVDNKLLFEDLFRKNTKETWKANESFELVVNQPKNITFYYNNKEISELKNFDSPKKLIIKDDQILITTP